MTVATIILEQLGGKKFLAMTGAKNLLDGGNYLQMDLPASLTKNRCNKFRITLDSNDTYTLELSKYAKLNLKHFDIRRNVYVDMLQEQFTDMTGLDTHL